MRLSIQSGSLIEVQGIEKGFQMAAEAGFQGMDLNLDHLLAYEKIKNGDCTSVFDQPDEALIELLRPYKEAAERNHIEFVQAHAPFPNYVPDEVTNAYVLEAVKKCVMLCGYLNCPALVVHPAFEIYGEALSAEEEWERNIRMYSALIPSLKQYGVTCCLENMFTRHRGKIMSAICQDPDETNAYIDELNRIAGETCFGFCLDIGHANLVGSDPYRLITKLGKRIRTLHIHDNNGLDDEHLFPYMGIIDWERFCKGLKDIGYEYDLNFETFRALKIYAPELAPQLLQLVGATAKLFRDKILG